MSNSLKTIFFVQWASFDCKRSFSQMESSYKKRLVSKGDLKMQVENFYKKRASQIDFDFFLILKLPMIPKLVFFIAFSLSGTQNWFIFWQEI